MALAAGLVGFSNVIDPRLPAGVQPVARAALGTALAHRARAPLGVHPPQLWSGLRVGLAVAAPVFVGVGASTVASPVRTAMAGRDLPASPSKWLAVRIPVGTVWAEETAYRAALATVAAEAFGPSGGRLLQSLAFGLSHVADARGTGAPVAPTVLVTAVAGWTFATLGERSGSLIAPMLAHLAINEAGAVATIAVQRRRS